MKTKILLITFLILNCAYVFAQDGALDRSFGIRGKTSTDLGGIVDKGNFVALQQDGKIIVAASSNNNFSSGFSLVRYTADGLPDQTFGTNGVVEVTVGMGTGKSSANAVALQSDGKIVAAGSVWNGKDDDIAVARFNSDGSPDLSFNNTGVVTQNTANSYDEGRAVAIQPDGKIVVAGYFFDVTRYVFTVLRYNADGTLDASFGNQGQVISDLGGSGSFINSMVLQPNGKIVVAGRFAVSSFKYDFALMRYNTNGSTDNSFGQNGLVLTSFGSSTFDQAQSVALQADGKIVAGGSTVGLFALARYNSDGSLDNSFGNDGSTSNSIDNGSSIGNSVAIQTDGKILLAGYAQTLTNTYFELNRYNTNGSLDASFGLHGVVEVSFFGQSNFGTSVAIQPDNKIVMAGYASKEKNSKLNADVAVARFLSGLELKNIDFYQESNSSFIYPNPISQNETLQYTLDRDANLTIALYDENGKMVQTFFSDEKRTAGDHTEQLNFKSSLPSGNYLLLISNGEKNISIKVFKQ